MANRRIEEQIEALARLRNVPLDRALPLIRKELAGKTNLVVAKAAQLVSGLAARDALPDLLRAFDRLFDDAPKRDPQCWGKVAIAKALRDLEHTEAAPLLRGARWIQMEPVWGGQADTAGPLRGVCLLALPACADLRREIVMRALVDALADPDPAVRQETARALTAMGGDDAALVLRLKARTGDPVSAVTGQVLESILAIERAEGLDFVKQFLLPDGGETAEEAALAIGSSRMESGVAVLAQAFDAARGPDYRAAILRALGISRRQEAAEFLWHVAEEGRGQDRAAAREALTLCEFNRKPRIDEEPHGSAS